jgi:DNA-binding IclR family transcriptional regulator
MAVSIVCDMITPKMERVNEILKLGSKKLALRDVSDRPQIPLETEVDGQEHTQKTESRALAKGLILLDYLGKKRTPLTLSELAEVAGLGKPSTLRILNTLQMTGWLVRDANDNYCLDREWPSAGSQAWVRRVTAAALPEMCKLNEDLGETVTLASLFDDHIRVVEVLDSPQLIRMANYKGRILPPYASSLGKAITAFQTPQKIAVLLQIFGTYRFTGNSITDPRAIQKALAEVRERGYACDNEETVAGGVCFGAPIRAADGTVSAAISVSTPKQRLTQEAYDTLPATVMDAAREISSALGCATPREVARQ